MRIGRTGYRSKHEGDERFIQNWGRKTRRKETSWEIWPSKGIIIDKI